MRQDREEVENRLESIFDTLHVPNPVPDVHRAVRAVDDSGMEVVMAHRDGRLLLTDPISVTHYCFEPTGPHGEYDNREQVDDIEIGEPVPRRFADSTMSDWEPVDRDWRHRVENGSVEAEG